MLVEREGSMNIETVYKITAFCDDEKYNLISIEDVVLDNLEKAIDIYNEAIDALDYLMSDEYLKQSRSGRCSLFIPLIDKDGVIGDIPERNHEGKLMYVRRRGYGRYENEKYEITQKEKEGVAQRNSEWYYPSKGELPENDSSVEFYDRGWGSWVLGGFSDGQFYDSEAGVDTDPSEVEKWRIWLE